MGEQTLRERVADAIGRDAMRHGAWSINRAADAALQVVDEAIGELRRNQAQRADWVYNRALEDVRRMLRGEEQRYGTPVVAEERRP